MLKFVLLSVLLCSVTVLGASVEIPNSAEIQEVELLQSEGDMLLQAPAGEVENSPCGCKGRVKDPSDQYPFDVKCRCEITKPDPGDLNKLKVAGRTELNGISFLGFSPFAANAGAPMQNGFYQMKGDKPGRVPDKTHPWMHLINARHSNKGNNHQMQLASSYAVNDRLFFRKVATTLQADNPKWNEVAVRSGRNTYDGRQTILLEPSSTNGNTVSLEMLQMDKNPPKIPTQHPSIRFHHVYRYWHRIEARSSGIHFKLGKTDLEDYTPVYASHFRSVSDSRAKQNVKELDGSLDQVKKLKSYQYHLVGKDYNNKATLTPSLGVMAQEVGEVIPHAVHTEETTGQKFVDYNALIATNLQATRELAKQTEEENKNLKVQLSDMKKEMDELKAMMAKIIKEK